jgi:hypothetical protein
MSADVTAGLFALAGATLGSLGTVAAQWWAGVVERRRFAHETTGRVNALAISVFRNFLAAAKIVEHLAELREAGQVPSNDEIRADTDQMWLGWQEVSVFCPTPIYAPSLAFTKALQQVVWHKPDSADVSDYLNKARGNLFDVAAHNGHLAGVGASYCSRPASYLRYELSLSTPLSRSRRM